MAKLFLVGCGTTKLTLREQNKMVFKELTKDVCRDNPHEIFLAQNLYKEMVLNNK